jgi:peptidoglycan/xylan/chitin deacetylase (PgdA/CDA1 family)
MEFLAKQNYNVISFDLYTSLIEENKLTQGTIALTFDDAYSSFSEIVLPVLEKYKYPAIVFVPVGFTGKYNEWDRQISDKKIAVLSWEKLRDITSNSLVTIGAHGYSHRALSALSPDEIAFEIVESKKLLEHELQKTVNYFSYPYGQYRDFNSFAVNCLKENGYKAACSTNWNKHNNGKSVLKLNRIEIEPGDTVAIFQKKLTAKFHIKYFKQKIKNVLSKLG